MILSPKEVDVLYDWLGRVRGLPTELCVSTLREAFVPSRHLAAVAGLLVIVDEPHALLFDSELERRLPDIVSDVVAKDISTQTVDVDVLSRKPPELHMDLAQLSLKFAEEPWFSRPSSIPELSPALAKWQASLNSQSRTPEFSTPEECLTLARRILCHMDCISSLLFRLPMSSGTKSGGKSPANVSLVWDYQLCFDSFRARRIWGLVVLATQAPLAEIQEQVRSDLLGGGYIFSLVLTETAWALCVFDRRSFESCSTFQRRRCYLLHHLPCGVH